MQVMLKFLMSHEYGELLEFADTYRKVPIVATLVTFRISSLWGLLLLGWMDGGWFISKSHCSPRAELSNFTINVFKFKSCYFKGVVIFGKQKP